MIAIFIFALVAGIIQAQICPDFSPDKNFKPKTVSGVWNLYEIQAINPALQKLKCAQLNFTPDEGVTRIKVTGTFQNGSPYLQKGTFAIQDIKTPAIITANYDSGPQEVIVLDSEENNYIVLGGCFSDKDGNVRKHVSVFTRDIILDAGKVDSIHSKLERYGIQISDMVHLPKIGC